MKPGIARRQFIKTASARPFRLISMDIRWRIDAYLPSFRACPRLPGCLRTGAQEELIFNKHRDMPIVEITVKVCRAEVTLHSPLEQIRNPLFVFPVTDILEKPKFQGIDR